MPFSQPTRYQVIIGLEIHAALKTASKMFCACKNANDNQPANTAVCPICLGHPGTLPNVNQKAIEQILLLGLALDCRINHSSKFDRKNYFYPDLPKGYQISQYDQPLCAGGSLLLEDKTIQLTRIHLEEDTGKLQHDDAVHSAVDFNRAGAPLLELVTEPVIASARQAKKFCQKFQQILRYLNISNADMEKGEMRCEANVSLQITGQWQYEGNGLITAIGNNRLNPKIELKNLNSFRALQMAIEYEILSADRDLAAFFENVISELNAWLISLAMTVVNHRRALAKLTANWLAAELLKHLKLNHQTVSQMKQVSAENFAELMSLLYLQKINSSAGQMILNQMYQVGGDPSEIMLKLNLEQLQDLPLSS